MTEKPIWIAQIYWETLNEEERRRLAGSTPEPAPSNEQLKYERLVNTSGATGIYEPDLEAVRQAKLRRNRIAEGFAFALVGRQSWHPHEGVVVMAIKYTDALIAELDK